MKSAKAVAPPADPAADAIRALVASIVAGAGVKFLSKPDVRLRLDLLVQGAPVGSIDVVLTGVPV